MIGDRSKVSYENHLNSKGGLFIVSAEFVECPHTPHNSRCNSGEERPTWNVGAKVDLHDEHQNSASPLERHEPAHHVLVGLHVSLFAIPLPLPVLLLADNLLVPLSGEAEATPRKIAHSR